MKRCLDWIMICVLSAIPGQVTANNDNITICIHPYKSSTKLIAAFTPLAQYLTEQLGRKVDLHVAKNYATHITTVGEGKYGIGYIGPASYVKLIKQYGKKRLLARQAIDGNPFFKGMIIVRKDSRLMSLLDLKGKRFAFGDPNSTMSHLVPRYMLIKAGVLGEDLAAFEFLGNHTNVALGVLAGSFDAGAVKEAVYYKYQDKGLKVLAETPSLSEHLFVAGDLLSEELVSDLRRVFLNAGNSARGLTAIRAIKSNISAMVPVQDSDYDNLRRILDTLESHGILQ